MTHWPTVQLHKLDQLARRQHGVVAFRQSGLSKWAWQRAIAAGTLIRIHPGVARLVGTAATPEQRILAAVLGAGPGALASYRSAAHLHGIPGFDDAPVDLIVVADPDARGDADATTESIPRTKRARTTLQLDGVEIHRPRDLARLSPHRIENTRCTNILRTLLDLGAVARRKVSGAVGHALTNDLANLDALETVLHEHARPGRTGITALRNAIDDWAIDRRPADSVLEPAMQRLVDRFGLPDVVFHPTILGREVDFRIVGTPIILECDGWTYHGRIRDQFESDRSNDARMLAAGWLVIRFTYRAVTTHPAVVAHQIEGALARWGNQPAPDAA